MLHDDVQSSDVESLSPYVLERSEVCAGKRPAGELIVDKFLYFVVVLHFHSVLRTFAVKVVAGARCAFRLIRERSSTVRRLSL